MGVKALQAGVLKRVWWRWRQKEGWFAVLIVVLVAYSLAILFSTWASGVAFNLPTQDEIAFAGYWEKLNWSLYPLLWIVMSVVVFHTWHQFDGAWKGIVQSEVLRQQNGDCVSAEQGEKIQENLKRYRPRLFVIAILAAAALTYYETSDIRSIHEFCEASDLPILLAASQRTSSSRISLECGPQSQRNNEWVCVEIGQEDSRGAATQTKPKNCPDVAASLSGNFEPDFSVAYLAGDISQKHNMWLNGFIYVQQVFIGAMGLLVLFQVCLQCFAFWFLREWPRINPEGLRIRLDPFSKINEFGLEAWNHALNNVYWVYAVALVVPILSRFSQDSDKLDPGQIILQVLVPVLIGAPMLISIIGRQQLQSDIWSQIQVEDDEQRVKRYHEQRLWPLDKNWASKLGIVISFALLVYLLGANLLVLTGG